MRISERQQRVLRAVNFDATATEASLARRLKLRTHTVRYEIQRAKSTGIIRPSIPVNFFKLGLRQFQYYASLTTGTSEVLHKANKFFRKAGGIAWYAHLGGRFQIGFSLCVLDESVFYATVDHFVQTVGQGFFKRHVGLTTFFEMYPKKYLHPSESNGESIAFDSNGKGVTIDSTDRRILKGLISRADLTQTELARLLGLPRTTVTQRIQRLENRELIGRRIYLLNAQNVGFTTMKLLLFMAHDSAELLVRLRRLCNAHPNIVNLVRLIGAWEYEITVEIKKPQDIQSILADLAKALGAWLKDVEVLQVFNQGRSDNFLIDAFSEHAE